ncbi:ATP synthase regulation protein NCA2 [Nitzschia inconspicua]|uniref:ATP synthase regulation protein NCA2 n=1 Tax=Nitzschia inconspicua TaxID=303405 RepID=A0A9K3LDH0_9STRA|nr:ATP synthase regulation protein NCA2 [Nitzschia inconspicua]
MQRTNIRRHHITGTSFPTLVNLCISGFLFLLTLHQHCVVHAKLRFPSIPFLTDGNNDAVAASQSVNSMAGGESAVSSGGGSSSSSSMPSLDASPSSVPVPTIPHPSSIANLADLENFLARIWEKYSLQFQSSFLKEILVSYPNQVVRFLWYNVILYKPPVGIVAAYTLTKLVTSGRLFQLQNFHLDGFTRGGSGDDKNNPNDPNAHDETSERALNKASKSRLDRHNCRALDLDRDDMVYKRFGGIERVRRRLAWSALDKWKEEHGDTHESTMTFSNPFRKRQDPKKEEKRPTTPQEIEDATITSLVDALDETLKVTFAPGGSHTEHVQEMIPFMARAEQCALELGILPPNGSGNSAKSMDSNMEKLLRLSLQTAELHILDSTLRLARDRLLRTSFRLSRTVKFWKRRVQSNNGALTSFFTPFLRPFVKGGMEGDRMRLAFAEAAYHAELVRLGRVIKMLDQRPIGMSDSNLELAVQKTLRQNKEEQMIAEASKPPAKTTIDSILSFSPFRFTFPPKMGIANFAIRYNADGRGKFSFQTYEGSITIGGKAAAEVLLDDFSNAQQPWLDKAQSWALQARGLIYDTVRNALETSVQPTEVQEEELAKFQSTWRTQQYQRDPPPSESIFRQWTFLYEMTRDINRLRRVGDGKSLKLKEVNILHWLRQWDLMGLPSAAFKIWLASLAHDKLSPYFPKFKAICDETLETFSEIFVTRFWTPFKDLLDELMHRETDKLMTGVSLNDEATSLDYMLRDLGYGDGTPATRHEAMLKASRQYESDMNSGLILHALGGRLVRLMLIQVQQLKVGMLDAAETIDVLFQANRFNLQLLAIIPAIVIVVVGSKFLSRFLFTVRAKDLRPMSSVHAEMTEYLNELESILLLTNRTVAQDRLVPAIQVMSEREVAEFALTLYDYLVLLDYSSPQPFPDWQCDAIHASVTEFLGQEGSMQRLTMEDQIRLVDLLKRKNSELSKYL